MLRCFPFRTAAFTLLVLFGSAIVFQIVVLAGFIPAGMVWGGRLASDQERNVGAMVSIALLILASLAVLNRMGTVGSSTSALGKWGMWAVCAVFGLNTIGNLFALDLRETLIFTPITLLCTVLAARLALGR